MEAASFGSPNVDTSPISHLPELAVLWTCFFWFFASEQQEVPKPPKIGEGDLQVTAPRLMMFSSSSV